MMLQRVRALARISKAELELHREKNSRMSILNLNFRYTLNLSKFLR